MIQECKSPFGGVGRSVFEMEVRDICNLYELKCGVDVVRSFKGNMVVGLYECSATGYRFWRPSTIAADESVYDSLRTNWEKYFRPNRWEYEIVDRIIPDDSVVLEVGCGIGHFLKRIVDRSRRILGIEPQYNTVAKSLVPQQVRCTDLDKLNVDNTELFDFVLSFQVLEHVVRPELFLNGCLQRTKTGGYLIVSTPNYLYEPHKSRKDAFDLPPHHMGHFTKSVFSALSNVIEFSLVDIVEQKMDDINDILGPNLIAVFRKD